MKREEKIIYSTVEPEKTLLWLHVIDNKLHLQKFGSNGWEDIGGGSSSEVYTKEETNTLLAKKQELLKSGQNIKTINNQPILGSGDIQIKGSAPFSMYVLDPADLTTAYDEFGVVGYDTAPLVQYIAGGGTTIIANTENEGTTLVSLVYTWLHPVDSWIEFAVTYPDSPGVMHVLYTILNGVFSRAVLTDPAPLRSSILLGKDAQAASAKSNGLNPVVDKPIEP